MKDEQKKMENILSELGDLEPRKALLLQVCCAPCASYVLQYLLGYFSDIGCFFYNPNIYPRGEYELRLINLENLIGQINKKNINMVHSEYEPEKFLNFTKGFSQEPEGGKRCSVCIRLRLEETAKIAQKMRYDYFATTLTVSPHKDPKLINKIGEDISRIYQVKYLPSDFKKRDGFKKSIILSKEYSLYRQNYCGCKYSMN